MAAFLTGLEKVGSVLGNYEQQKAIQRGKLAGLVASQFQGGSGIPSSPSSTMDDSMPADNAAMTPPPVMNPAPPPVQSNPMPNAPAAPQAPGPPPAPMSTGRVVTTPTLAVLGEDGAEAVIPLNGAPDNKTNMAMVSPYSRYQRR